MLGQHQRAIAETPRSALPCDYLGDHGIYRARSAEQEAKRRSYLEAVFAAIPVKPFTRDIGHTVAKLDAEARAVGIVIPFVDLLIGGTAFHLGYAVVTRNESHFRMIRDLKVVPF